MRLALVAVLLAFPAAASAAYVPQVTLSAGGGPGAPAAINATITQAPGEDSHRTIEARLPGTFAFNTGFARGDAPIGRINAESVFGPASGELFLTADYRVVGSITGLGGLVTVPFNGILEVLEGQRIVLRFDNLPDVAATRLSLQMDGGTHTPLALPRSCGTHTIAIRLVGRAGDERVSQHAIDVSGCRGALPTVNAARVTQGVLRWRARGAARTDVVLRRLVRGTWRELARRSTTAPRLRLWRLRRGARHAVALTPIAADGTRGLTHVLRL